MTLNKTLPALSFAFALIGGTLFIAPAPAKAAGHISYEALKRNNIPQGQRSGHGNNSRPGAQANPWSRGCSAITHCRG